MQDRPTAIELIAAVKHFLEQEVLPIQEDHRLRFRTLVAANALAIVHRELSAGAALAERECERLHTLLDVPSAPSVCASVSGGDMENHVRALRLELARRIRQGAADHGTWRQAVIASTLTSIEDKLTISNPKLVAQHDHT